MSIYKKVNGDQGCLGLSKNEKKSQMKLNYTVLLINIIGDLNMHIFNAYI